MLLPLAHCQACVCLCADGIALRASLAGFRVAEMRVSVTVGRMARVHLHTHTHQHRPICLCIHTIECWKNDQWETIDEEYNADREIEPIQECACCLFDLNLRRTVQRLATATATAVALSIV